jgi:hypothetical protein
MDKIYKIAKNILALEFKDYNDYNKYLLNHKVRKNTDIKFKKQKTLKNKEIVDKKWVNNIGHDSFNEIVNSPSTEVISEGKNKTLKHEEKSPSGNLIETKFFKNGKSQNGFDKSQNRVAMFQLSRILGFNTVPPTSYSKYSSKDQKITGTEELVVKGDNLKEDKNYSNKYKNDKEFKKGIQQVAVLDIISGTKDRKEDSVIFNGKNMFVTNNADTFNKEQDFYDDNTSFAVRLLCGKDDNVGYDNSIRNIVDNDLLDEEIKNKIINIDEKTVGKMIDSIYGKKNEEVKDGVLSRLNKLQFGLKNGFVPNENNFNFSSKKAEEYFISLINQPGINQETAEQMGDDISKFSRKILQDEKLKANYRKSPEIAKKDFIASLMRNNYEDLESYERAIQYFTKMPPLEFVDMLFSIE